MAHLKVTENRRLYNSYSTLVGLGSANDVSYRIVCQLHSVIK